MIDSARYHSEQEIPSMWLVVLETETETVGFQLFGSVAVAPDRKHRGVCGFSLELFYLQHHPHTCYVFYLRSYGLGRIFDLLSWIKVGSNR